MSVNSSVFSDLQSINPSAIIELFTLQLSTALHGANTIYRFHAGSNLNANGQIVWAGNSYLRFPIKASGFGSPQYNGFSLGLKSPVSTPCGIYVQSTSKSFFNPICP